MDYVRSYGKNSRLRLLYWLYNEGVFLLLDRIIPHLHIGSDESRKGREAAVKSPPCWCLRYHHNIPEGNSPGESHVTGLARITPIFTVAGAFALSIGITIQNFYRKVHRVLQSGAGSHGRARPSWILSGIVELIAGGDYRLLLPRRLPHHAHSAISFGLCGGSRDLCSGGGTHSGIRGNTAISGRSDLP